MRGLLCFVLGVLLTLNSAEFADRARSLQNEILVALNSHTSDCKSSNQAVCDYMKDQNAVQSNRS
jgi:hypothetical protein